MAHSLSQRKRVRQNEVRRQRNRARKSEIKSHIRKFLDAVHDREVASAEEHFRNAAKRLDQAAAGSTMHKNTAARKKARLAKRLNAIREKAGA